VANLDQTRANWLALGLLRKKARELLTVNATTIGLPRLRPGRHVEIRGMRAPFDGFYYVTRTVHTFGSKGLQTEFSASRPGMELPPYRLQAGQTGAGA
jgi:phage protein D